MSSTLKLSDRLVWVDCEMTGLDSDKDTLLEVAVIITDDQLDIVAEGPNLIIHQPDSVLAAMGDWCTKQHGNSGLTRAVQESKLNLSSCEKELLAFVSKHTPKGKCPLAGNSVGMDAVFLRKYMPQLMEHLHYRVVDVSTIKELVRRWYPEVQPPKKKITHRALDDIRESLVELKFYREKVFMKSEV